MKLLYIVIFLNCSDSNSKCVISLVYVGFYGGNVMDIVGWQLNLVVCGIVDILIFCFIMFGLCIWIVLYFNVVGNDGWYVRIWVKIFWVLLCLFVLELIVVFVWQIIFIVLISFYQFVVCFFKCLFNYFIRNQCRCVKLLVEYMNKVVGFFLSLSLNFDLMLFVFWCRLLFGDVCIEI